MKIRISFTILLLLLSMSSNAQDRHKAPDKNNFWENTALQFNYEKGHIFGTNEFLKGNNALVEALNKFQAFSLRFSKQSTGENQWEQLFNYPNWGMGFYLVRIDNSKEIGLPWALYGFFNAPFKRWNGTAFNYDLSFGAAFNWRSFDPVSNKYNTAIGASQSFYINAGLSIQYFIAKNVDVETGLSFTHFSNGTLKKPTRELTLLRLH
jgi:hypothetical protein